MSSLVNQHIIEQALERAADLDDIESSGHLNTVKMYIEDNDLDNLFHYLKEITIILRAHNDLAEIEYCE